MSTVRKNVSGLRGSVMVVGGGIAGIQTSLDLAESGFKVHLVEQSPSIGGNMVKLDKTFPTNDCSMCMISPKLVACARHPNIEIHALSEVISVERDQVGNFNITVLRHPRSVDLEKCTGCGVCMEECPVRNVVELPEKEPVPPPLPETDQAVIEDVFRKQSPAPENLIPVLQAITARRRYIPPEYLPHVSAKMHIPLARVLRVATFYNAFSLKPVGRHIIEICSGTACHVRGSGKLIKDLTKNLQIAPGETTPDERFTFRTVNCIGCCALAPAVRVDGTVFAQVKPRELPLILKDFT